MSTALASLQRAQTTAHFLLTNPLTAEDPGKKKKKEEWTALQEKIISRLCDVDNFPANLLIMIMSFAFLVGGGEGGDSERWFGEKQLELENGSEKQETKCNRQTQAQWFNFLLTSHFLSSLLSSKAQGEMWLKLEFPLAGEAEKQESKGRGKTDGRLTALSLHKQKVC